jgi:hypothetical protein
LQYQSKGDTLLLGDFNARLGDITGNCKTNGNADLMKEFLTTALHDGAMGEFSSILNASKFSFASPTRVEGPNSSIIDYLLAANSTLPRSRNVQVESDDQVRGAIGCGSDHNLLWLDYSLHFDLPSRHAPPPRLVFDRIAFQKEEVQTEYQDQLSPLLEDWNLKVRPILESPLFLLLPPALRSAIMDGFYQQWTFLFYQAKCHSVPIKSISPCSRI